VKLHPYGAFKSLSFFAVTAFFFFGGGGGGSRARLRYRKDIFFICSSV
jgi:hypothetical protein